ncbi:MAG: hypothetical protein GWM98_26610, partial [Nitrospinaceae bacterium]|nr:hypothetical protein [Nitrospinaceae bacterium]NIR57389.1 hypothetical protein [Nitrospinaceae bacterium]NIS87841.1 hypothetical protein [Nitrospinaceae bacterium]NIT84712.1 hypothetical protein [Nitrospinaceae bacterium]NIU46890.1 hypothetical protein [Nitrospinaceae bacterium]
MKLRDRVKALAGFLKIPWSWEMELAAMLSPLGSAAIPPEIMVKVHRGQSLSPDEKDMVAAVPRIGEQLLANIPRLASVARIVLYQNKRFDGSGYPRDKLAGHEIPIGAQILKILSDLIELESEDLPRAQALEQMGKRPGWYDPDILKKVAACFLEKGEVKDHSENQPVPVSLCDLRPGHVLESNIETEDGTMLFAAGQKVEPLHLQRLRNYAKLRKIVEPLY